MNNLEKQYTEARGQQLAGKTSEELISMVASLELELLDYADRFLSDNPNFDQVFPIDTLELIGEEAVELFKSLDTEKEYDGLASYD